MQFIVEENNKSTADKAYVFHVIFYFSFVASLQTNIRRMAVFKSISVINKYQLSKMNPRDRLVL